MAPQPADDIPQRNVPQQNVESFAKKTVLIAGETVNHQAVQSQESRAKELRELIQRGQEEFFNVFEMVPQTAQDIYFNRIAAGALKTAIVSCSDDTVERDC